MPSRLLQTTQAYIRAFDSLSTETFAALLSDAAIHQYAPASAQAPEPKSRAQFISHITSLKEVLAGIPLAAKQIVESEGSNQVVIWATSQAIFRDEVKDSALPINAWDYRGEYIFFLTMNKTQDKITNVVEFLDSKGTDGIKSLIARARGNRK